MTANPLDLTAATFRRFAEVETAGSLSPLYEQLSRTVMADPWLCQLANEARPGQPKPNMLFAAVQYLLEDEPADLLRAFYPAFAGTAPAGDPGPAFRAFCERHREAITSILHSRMVQTNEVRRSACLLPAFATIAAATQSPLALIEIGPSAGLNLLFDRYRYDYARDGFAGDPASPVLLDADSRGEPLPLAEGIPHVVLRVGIDLNPLDVRDAGDRRWLRALVWPEHHDRRELLERACALAAQEPPRLLAGDVVELLPREVRASPVAAAVCVVATFVLNQFTAAMRDQLRALLSALSREREIFVVLMGVDEFVTGTARNTEEVSLWLLRFRGGAETHQLLADCHPHGRWIKWIPQPSA